MPLKNILSIALSPGSPAIRRLRCRKHAAVASFSSINSQMLHQPVQRLMLHHPPDALFFIPEDHPDQAVLRRVTVTVLHQRPAPRHALGHGHDRLLFPAFLFFRRFFSHTLVPDALLGLEIDLADRILLKRPHLLNDLPALFFCRNDFSHLPTAARHKAAFLSARIGVGEVLKQHFHFVFF